jgi:hypothetical protein
MTVAARAADATVQAAAARHVSRIAPMQAGPRQRQVDAAIHPVEQQIEPVPDVVDQRTALHRHPHGDVRDADREQHERDGPERGTGRGPEHGQRHHGQRQHHDEEPGRRAVPGPPHLV